MQWFEDEDFWSELYGFMFSPAQFALAVEQVDQICALTQISGGKLLDLCCGPGRHSVPFAQKGFQVTGVDRSPYLLERARSRAEELGVPVEWVRQDMREFRRPATFDLACSLFTSFGYFDQEADDLGVLRNVCESLREGGVMVIDVTGKERLMRIWQNTLSFEFDQGSLLVMRPQFRDDLSRVENEWVVVKDGRSRAFHFQHWVYSGRELKDRLLASGFREVNLYGDVAGAPFGMDSPRLVAVARK